MADYLTAWDNMVTALNINSSSKWNTLSTAVNKAKKYGYSSKYSNYNGGYVYDIFDAKGALTQLKSSFSSASSEIQTVLDFYSNNRLIAYERHGSQMSGSNGLCLFCPISGANTISYCYTSAHTNFSSWQAICETYGNW